MDAIEHYDTVDVFIGVDVGKGGASFKSIADALGHHSLDTTTIYAKLDLPTLSSIAMPWPGGAYHSHLHGGGSCT